MSLRLCGSMFLTQIQVIVIIFQMEKILIFGNSGSGKSTMAIALSKLHKAAHLDLDTIAWRDDQPTVRADLDTSRTALHSFFENNENWIIEGCYADLLSEAAKHCTEMIFLNPGIEACVANCRARPWEPHKYATPEAQNENLKMLIEWVREYETREDVFSLEAHRRLFDSFARKKTEYRSNAETQSRLNQK